MTNLFEYKDEDGKSHHMPITDDGYHVFELNKGSYQRYRSHLTVFIDNVLKRIPTKDSNKEYGLVELTSNRFALKDKLEKGQVVTVQYIQTFRIGNPYPRIYLNIDSPNTPDKGEEGDFWLDKNYDDSVDPESHEPINSVDWDHINGKPNTLEGYGIRDNFVRVGHQHVVKDIIDFPTMMKANGGDSSTVGGHAPGVSPGNVLVIDSTGKIPSNVLPDDFMMETKMWFIQSNQPTNPKKFSIWFDTTKDKECIHMFTGSTWITFGAYWKDN